MHHQGAIVGTVVNFFELFIRRLRHILMLELLRDLWFFMLQRKKFWLVPIILIMVLLGGLIVLTQGSALAPFIYTIF